MLKLGILLIGSSSFQRQWYILIAVGALSAILGFSLILGQASVLGRVILTLFGLSLLIHGASTLKSIFSDRRKQGAVHWSAPLLTVLLGLTLVGSIAAGDDRFVSVFLAIVLLLDGTTRMAPAVFARYPTWQYNLTRSVVETSLAIMLASEWPLDSSHAIDSTVGIALLLSGWGACRLGYLLRTHDEEVALLLLPVFGNRGWYDHAPVLAEMEKHDAEPPQHLTLYVWLPDPRAAKKGNLAVVGRYLAAKNREGSISVGHVALELPSGIYLSHYRDLDTSPPLESPIKAIANSQESNVLGVFRRSYSEESTVWGHAHAQIRIEHFNVQRLKAFWTGYKQDTTYNLSNRNCSTLVAAALDAAIEGALSGLHPWRQLGRLYLMPDFWQASFIRNRAEAGTWTPGLIHDYATPLARILTLNRVPQTVYQEYRIS